MSRQQSQKRGIRSDAEKQMRARSSYESIPPSNAVGGAFGEHTADIDTDEDVSLRMREKQTRKKRSVGEGTRKG